MPIDGYTTSIQASTTVAEITKRLAKAGARGIFTEFDGDGEPTGVSFMIQTEHGERGFSLPVRVDGVLATLRRDKVARNYQTPQHAKRVAWRVALVWLKAQLAIIDAGMVTLDEVMLPYALVDGNSTMYEAVRERGLRAAIEA